MSKKNNAENILSKAGTAIKSAAEYAFFEGVGKTAKNFATGVSTGAKQGYGYFKNDINSELKKFEGLVDKELQKLNQDPVTQKNDYTKLSIKDKFNYLFEKSQSIDSVNNSTTRPDEINKNLPNSITSQLDPEIMKKFTHVKNYENNLNKLELHNLAEASGVSNGKPYKNAQTYEEKITLIEIALKAKQKQLNSAQDVQSLKQKVQDVTTHEPHSDQALSSNDFIALIKKGEELYKKQEDKAAVDLQLQELETTKQTLTDLRSAEAELLNPKQNRVVRALKKAAGVTAGITIGALKGSGAAVKTAAKAVKNAPSGIRDTYRKNRSNNQKSR